MHDQVDIVVAGHICLDIMPKLIGAGSGKYGVPGTLTEVGPAVLSTGGAVSNTGLALHRLGQRAVFMGKVGDDALGRATLDLLRANAPDLVEGMIEASGAASSYTIVLSPPGVDRSFLHYPGPNHSFCADDVDYALVEHARLFHFGYPTLMRRMYEDGGVELERILRRVKEHGVTTSLDMTFVDPDSEAGRADWPGILRRALPHVDVFLPSLDEILFMLDRARFDKLQLALEAGVGGFVADTDLLRGITGRLLDMGVAVAGLKLGEQGMYLRTTDDSRRLETIGASMPRNIDVWRGRELSAPCFEVNVATTNGAGDCAIAGFLAALLRGLCPEDALKAAVAVGACSVEQPDTTSGVPHWDAVQARIARGWARKTYPTVK